MSGRKLNWILVISTVLCVGTMFGCDSEEDSTDTSPPIEESQSQSITTDGIWIKDDLGRTLILRGVNLGGSTKMPAQPDGASHIREGFFDCKNVSFVGRPFPLEEADEHFSRLKEWGLTFIRFLVTWEAIEHAGPGQYDEAYLNYVRDVVEKAGEYGINVFIDPHQDAWSRWTGGDGAPAWVLEKIGMDITKLHETGAAFSHQISGDPYPHMMWPTNRNKLGAATMYTLFFAGNEYAPNTKVDGVPVQEYLQNQYINAVKEVARRVADLPNVVGYDSMNEPDMGFIALPNLDVWDTLLTQGLVPTPAQALMGSMYPQEVGMWALEGLMFVQQGTETMNTDGISIWREGPEDIWKANGVWTDEGGVPRILQPNYFATVNGHEVNFERDFLKPFLLRYIEEIRSVDPDALVFVESRGEYSNPIPWGSDDPPHVVHAPHWYDGLTLFTKSYDPEFNMRTHPKLGMVFGAENVQAMFEGQLRELRDRGTADEIPTLIGEFGLPFNLNDGESYRTGGFETQTRAMADYLQAMDANLLSYTLWCYTADNTNERGDQCYGEDFSIFSQDQRTDPEDINSGGRALKAVVRPYARATAGEPHHMSFDISTRIFKYEYSSDPTIDAPTEIFVPNLQYLEGYTVELSHGTFEKDEESQTLQIFHPEDQKLGISVRLLPFEN
ncbi:MAG: cellulase family glycosylhydrolase [Chloroflexi bacterium]|nr:cellulase family glycosylhydrolase [Chloroflexota bacterium]